MIAATAVVAVVDGVRVSVVQAGRAAGAAAAAGDAAEHDHVEGAGIRRIHVHRGQVQRRAGVI